MSIPKTCSNCSLSAKYKTIRHSPYLQEFSILGRETEQLTERHNNISYAEKNVCTKHTYRGGNWLSLSTHQLQAGETDFLLTDEAGLIALGNASADFTGALEM